MITLPEGSSKEVTELIEYLNAFLPALFEADTKRGNERVTSFVELATKYEMFTVEDAVAFANKPLV